MTPTELPTLTPTATETPTITPSPTIVPTPSSTPAPVTAFAYDNWENIPFSAETVDALQRLPFIAFVNQNNRDSIGDTRTPQPGRAVQTLYYISPGVTSLIPVLEMDVATGTQIYPAPTGDVFAYFRQDLPGTSGLYIVDLAIRFSGRVLPMESLIQRGFLSEPSWSPDGARMAIALATGYDMDVYTVGRDGTNPTPITRSGAYEFFPAWSPDGQYIAFVSDRETCPSWIPGEAGTCDGTGASPPRGGQLFMVEVATGEVSHLSDTFITEPPRWVNERQIAFSSGEPALGDPGRSIWLVDIFERNPREFRLGAGGDTPIKLAESWSPGGSQVLYQAADGDTEIVLANADGSLVGRFPDLTFSRYGMVASWSPDGTRVAIGGVGSQCPYGVIVLRNTAELSAQSNPPPSMCDPVYSPDGRFIAFVGVNPSRDGRLDVYYANNNGFGTQIVTGSLRGQMLLLGWVGAVGGS
jgi:Tol biopolymer transport system component